MNFFFFNDTATTEIYTLSLHDALPICRSRTHASAGRRQEDRACGRGRAPAGEDRKSTRLNSSHQIISYAVFCLKKKKKLQLEMMGTENEWIAEKAGGSEHRSGIVAAS